MSYTSTAPPFHGGNTGSNPVRVAQDDKMLILSLLYRIFDRRFWGSDNELAGRSVENDFRR